ncbi:PaaI family thioesterase [Psychroserpens sp. MEBiC05023]
MYKVLTRFLERFFKPATIYRYGFNWSPMYRRTTARVIEVSDDLHRVVIAIRPNWKNRNFVGTIFGGSMLAATDPIYMIQLMQILGDDYVVWDKSVEAHYKRPGRSKIFGEFVFTPQDIDTIKKDVAQKNEINLIKTMSLVDANQNIIATFIKTLYIADKRYYKNKLKKRQANNT